MADYNQVHENNLGSDALIGNSTFQHNAAYHDLQHDPINGLPAPQTAPLLGAHLQEHGRISVVDRHDAFTLRTQICVDPTCYKTFGTNEQLRKHGEKEGHKPYGCVCSKKFGRLDTLKRHISSKSRNGPLYSCEHCPNSQGKNRFARRDHLTQHIRLVHKSEATGELGHHATAIVSNAEASQIMMPAYDCPVLGCPRLGLDGFVRKEDVDLHVAFMHPYNMQNNVSNQQYEMPMQSDQHDGASSSNYQGYGFNGSEI